MEQPWTLRSVLGYRWVDRSFPRILGCSHPSCIRTSMPISLFGSNRVPSPMLSADMPSIVLHRNRNRRHHRWRGQEPSKESPESDSTSLHPNSPLLHPRYLHHRSPRLLGRPSTQPPIRNCYLVGEFFVLLLISSISLLLDLLRRLAGADGSPADSVHDVRVAFCHRHHRLWNSRPSLDHQRCSLDFRLVCCLLRSRTSCSSANSSRPKLTFSTFSVHFVSSSLRSCA